MYCCCIRSLAGDRFLIEGHMRRKLSVSERVEIARDLIVSIHKFKGLFFSIKALLRPETERHYPNVVDANKRDPDTWSQKSLR